MGVFSESREAPLDWGDVRCACGLAYRYAVTGIGVLFWPQSSPSAFRALPVLDDHCVRCDARLSGLTRTSGEAGRKPPSAATELDSSAEPPRGNEGGRVGPAPLP